MPSGLEVDATGGETSENRNPATGEIIDTVPLASPEDVERAIVLGVDAGACVVGVNGNYRLSQQPFGGHKQSGMGTEGAMFSIKEMMKIKTVVLKDVM